MNKVIAEFCVWAVLWFLWFNILKTTPLTQWNQGCWTALMTIVSYKLIFSNPKS